MHSEHFLQHCCWVYHIYDCYFPSLLSCQCKSRCLYGICFYIFWGKGLVMDKSWNRRNKTWMNLNSRRKHRVVCHSFSFRSRHQNREEGSQINDSFVYIKNRDGNRTKLSRNNLHLWWRMDMGDLRRYMVTVLWYTSVNGNRPPLLRGAYHFFTGTGFANSGK